MLLYFASYCVKEPPKDKPAGQARRPRTPELLCGGASIAMPTSACRRQVFCSVVSRDSTKVADLVWHKIWLP